MNGLSTDEFEQYLSDANESVIPKFNRLYLYSNSDEEKWVFSFLERQNGTDELIISYEGFETDFCKELNKTYTGRFGCRNLENESIQVIYVNSSYGRANPMFSQWINLTAKLRVS